MSGVTIGQGATFNQYAYSIVGLNADGQPVNANGGEVALPTGWTALQPYTDPASGLTAVTFVNSDTDSVYVAFRGTQTMQDVLESDSYILAGQPPLAANDVALTYFQSVQALYPDATVETGGHSLGGEEAAYVSSQLGVPALVENAPDTSGTINGPYSDADILQINETWDIVGHVGPSFDNSVTIDTGASAFAQAGAAGTHSIANLNDYLSQIPSLANQALNSYNFTNVNSPYISAFTENSQSSTISQGVSITYNPDGSTTYQYNDGSSVTVAKPDSSGTQQFSESVPSPGDGLPSSTVTGVINQDGSLGETINYSDGSRAIYQDDGQGNSSEVDYNSSGALVSVTNTVTTQSADGTTSVSDTYDSSGALQTEVSQTISNNGDTRLQRQMRMVRRLRQPTTVPTLRPYPIIRSVNLSSIQCREIQAEPKLGILLSRITHITAPGPWPSRPRRPRTGPGRTVHSHITPMGPRARRRRRTPMEAQSAPDFRTTRMGH
jgi:Protein of unknown function (DUF2974)